MEIVLIVVGVLVLIAVIGLVMVTGRQKREQKKEEHRHEASEIRSEAQVHGHQADRAKAEADEAAARARREQATAKEAAAKAEHAGRQRDARHAEANQIDPDADDDAPLGDPHGERARHDRTGREAGRDHAGLDRGEHDRVGQHGPGQQGSGQQGFDQHERDQDGRDRHAATDQAGAVPTQPGAPPPADQQGAPRDPEDPGTSGDQRRGEPRR